MSTALADQLYDWLAEGPSPEMDRILGAALEYAEPPWLDRIMRILLRRNEDASWAGLIGRYETLPSEIREHLRGDLEKLYAAAAIAIRSRSARVRAGALTVLNETAPPRMAYLIPRALRDPQRKTRVLAGRVLHKMAESVLEQEEAQDPDARLAQRDERQQLVMALQESIRTVDMHGRNEVLEAALWFAVELEDELWELLNSRRSRAGIVVREHLHEWNHPRLAPFLILSLTRPNWRELAARLLQSWNAVDQVAAILCATPLLDRPGVRGSLNWISNPRWFDRFDETLERLPENLRPLGPRWAPNLGVSDEQKVALLGRMASIRDQRVHRAAVYALAELKSSDAQRILRNIAESRSPLADFARWYAAGRQFLSQRRGTEPGDRTQHARHAAPRPSAAVPLTEAGRWFEKLWALCLQAEPAARHELLGVLREFEPRWHAELAARAKSPNPRDRLLWLQVVGAPGLVGQFADELDLLARDPVEPIRALAERSLRAVGRDMVTPLRVDGAPLSTSPPRDAESLAVARGDLSELMESLADGTVRPNDVEQILRLRGLLAEVLSVRERRGTVAEALA